MNEYSPLVLWDAAKNPDADEPDLLVSDETQAITVMRNKRQGAYIPRWLYEEPVFLRLWSLLPYRMDHEPFWDKQYELIAKATPWPIKTVKCCGRKLPRYIQVGSNFMIYCEVCGWHVSTFTGSKEDIVERWEQSLAPQPHLVERDWRSAMMRFRKISEQSSSVTEAAIRSNSRITVG